MRVQTQILFYVLCINVASIIAVTLQVPGVAYSQNMSTGLGSLEDIVGKFNATDVGSRFSQNPLLGFLDTVVGAANFIFATVPYLFFGYAIILQWIGAVFIQDAAGQTAYNVLVDALVAVFSFLMFVWFVEIISGRQLFD